EEVSGILGILPAEPVLDADGLDARHRRDPPAVAHRHREDQRDLVAGDEPGHASELDRLLQRVEHAAERAEQEHRHHHAQGGEDGAALVAAEIDQHQPEEAHARPPPLVSTPLSSCTTRPARSAACGSWVTITMVFWNSRLRRSSSWR